jgi:hypothetical protein
LGWFEALVDPNTATHVLRRFHDRDHHANVRVTFVGRRSEAAQPLFERCAEALEILCVKRRAELAKNIRRLAEPVEELLLRACVPESPESTNRSSSSKSSLFVETPEPKSLTLTG